MLPRIFIRALPGLVLLVAPALSADLQIHILMVGQGSSALVVGPDGTRVLIDGGNPGDGLNVVVPWLQSHGVNGLEYSVATHWHADHVGGMDEVFNIPGLKPTIAAYDRGNTSIPSTVQVNQYLAAVASPAGLRQTPAVGATIPLGGGATLQFTSANGQYLGGTIAAGLDENARSVSCVIRYGSFDCWITGDLTGGGGGTANVESPASAFVGQVEMMVAGHHGSDTSSNATAIAVLTPSFVVASCGLDNSFGHPARVTVDRWNSPAASRVVWATTAGDTTNGSGGFLAANGHVLVTSDGQTFTATRSSGPESLRFACFGVSATAAEPGRLALSEVLVDPVGSSDAFGEWLELVGLSTYAVDLKGLEVESGAAAFTIASRLLLHPGQRMVLGVDGRASRNGNVFTALCAPWEQFALSNAPSSIVLTSPTSAPIETLAWGGGGFAVQPGASAERIDLFGGTSPANFATATGAWAGGDLGSPNAANGNEAPSCAIPASYCTGSPNSAGPGARMGFAGTSNVTANDLVLLASGCPPNKNGIFFYGPNAAQNPYGNGFVCVGSPLFRLQPPVTADNNGLATRALDLGNLPAGGGIAAGDVRKFSFWYRDPTLGAGFNFSDGLSIAFCAY